MPVLKNLASIGIARQTALGAAAATPVFGFGLASGTLFDIDVTQEPDPLTGFGSRIRAGSDRNDGAIGAKFAFRAYPRSIPLFYYGALGAIVTTGTTPKVHTISPDANGALPYFTLFTRYGSDYNSIADCQIDELTFSFSRGVTEVSCTLVGLTPSFAVTPWTATNDESAQTRYTSFGGTYLLNPITTSPAAAKVSGAEITISNNIIGQRLSATLLPVGIVPGPQEIKGSITLQPDDFVNFRSLVTGAAAGTTVTGVVPVGSFSIFQTIGANDDITLSSLNWQATTSYPDVDPSGGVMELVLEGQGYGASGLSVVAHNTYATAY